MDIKEIEKQINEKLTQVDQATNPEERATILEEAQETLNKAYQTQPCDELIDIQVQINTYRNKYDITDPREIIHWDNGKGFVQ